MLTSNLKTFIYSFSISLLIIFSAKVFVVSKYQEDKSTNKTISNKNIALFLKKDEIINNIASVKTPLVLVSNLSDIKSYDTNINDILHGFSLEENLSNSEISHMDINIDDEKLTQIFIDSAYNDIDAYELANNIIENRSILEKAILQDNLNIQYAENKVSKTNEKNHSETIAEIFAKENAKLQKENPIEVAVFVDESVDKDDFIPIVWNGHKTPSKNIKIASKIEKDNIIAMGESSVPVKSLIQEEDEKKSKTNNSENPWVVATGKNFSNNSLLQDTLNKEDKTTASSYKVAKMVKNILIPIPEDILNDADATPQLVTSEKNKELKEKIEANIIQKPSNININQEEKIVPEAVIAVVNEDKIPEKNIEKIIEKISIDEKAVVEKSTTSLSKIQEKNDDFTPAIKKEKKTIFDSITNIFSNNLKMPEIGVTKDKNLENRENSVFQEMSKIDKNNKKVTKILPTEIKLSFQPNRSEISGPTLRWLEAFANKTIEDESIALEIRIDGTSSIELQQKRLGLLHNILTNKGVNYNKINTVFTAREANSFIIRTVRIDKQAVNANVNNRIANDSKIYQSW